MRLRVRAFKTKSGFRYSGGEEKRLDRILTQRDLDAPEVLLHDALQVDQVPAQCRYNTTQCLRCGRAALGMQAEDGPSAD